MELATWPRSTFSVFDELESLHEGLSRMFSEPDLSRVSDSFPHLNVWLSSDGLIIDAELPGVDPKDVDVSLVGDELILRGKVNVQEPRSGETFYQRERPSGEFSRTLQLPFRAEAGMAKASYKNGVLRLTVPRSEQEKPRKIAIEAS